MSGSTDLNNPQADVSQLDPTTERLYVRGQRVFDPVADVIEFHKKFGLHYSGKPRALVGELRKFRIAFIDEERNEYVDSGDTLEAYLKTNADNEGAVAETLEFQLDALIDLIYVTIGAAVLQFPEQVVKEAWRRVQEKNMQKVRAERAEDSKRGSTFDVVKPRGWTPPSHIDLVKDHAHKGVGYEEGSEEAKGPQGDE